MDVKEFERIKALINRNELEKAKAQGFLETIRKKWKEEYGTDDPEKIQEKLEEMKDELGKANKRLETLHKKLEDSYDWDKLEEELG